MHFRVPWFKSRSMTMVLQVIQQSDQSPSALPVVADFFNLMKETSWYTAVLQHKSILNRGIM